MGQPPDEIDKPHELLAARTACEALFAMLQRWFAVPGRVTIDLATIDSAVGELGEPRMVAAMAMRKLQALHLLTTPGVVTSTDVVLTVIQDLDRALRQAPVLRLREQAEHVDWDAELAELAALDDDDLAARLDHGTAAEDDARGGEPVPSAEEVGDFRRHHEALHEAAKAVLHASHGRIVRLR